MHTIQTHTRYDILVACDARWILRKKTYTYFVCSCHNICVCMCVYKLLRLTACLPCNVTINSIMFPCFAIRQSMCSMSVNIDHLRKKNPRKEKKKKRTRRDSCRVKLCLLLWPLVASLLVPFFEVYIYAGRDTGVCICMYMYHPE